MGLDQPVGVVADDVGHRPPQELRPIVPEPFLIGPIDVAVAPIGVHEGDAHRQGIGNEARQHVGDGMVLRRTTLFDRRAPAGSPCALAAVILSPKLGLARTGPSHASG